MLYFKHNNNIKFELFIKNKIISVVTFAKRKIIVHLKNENVAICLIGTFRKDIIENHNKTQKHQKLCY
jgi:hypothetical protein